MYFELKENRPHGTVEYPFTQYHIKNSKNAFQIPVHWHDELEIIYIINGPLYVNISGDTYIGNKGDIFVVSPGELHFMGSEQLKMDYYTFLFPLEFISFQTNDWLEEKIFLPLRSRTLNILHSVYNCGTGGNVNNELHIRLCELLDILIAGNKDDLHRSDDANSYDTEYTICAMQIETRIVLLRFIQLLYENNMFTTNDTVYDSTDKELISYIQQNYMERLSLKELGNLFHMSEKYISRYFKKHFHITISQYINHLRLEHAKQLLAVSNLSVTDVAMQSGFTNVSYFIRSFKKIYGISPRKFRVNK